jgi:hypothetical protein
MNLLKLNNSLSAFDDDSTLELEKLVDNEVYQLEIIEETKNRTVAQNRLMWGWLTDFQRTKIEALAGTTKEEWHERMKHEYLIHIYERDNPDYAEMIETLRDVYRAGLKKEGAILLKNVIKNTSTTEATVGQFREYLECIERFAHENGIWLRTDPKIYRAAMGST